MKLAAHPPLESCIHHLMLLYTRFAAEGFSNDGRGIMVTIAGKIADLDIGIRKGVTEERLNIFRTHCHG